MAANAKEESFLNQEGYSLIAGIDETGMGSLAGDVYVAAVILPKGIDFTNILPGLDDSKKKSPAQREKLYGLIKEVAISYAVKTASIDEIATHNIYWARFIAARRAVNALSIKPDFVLMDGNATIPELYIPQLALVKGDTRSISIAAASILAKVDRDRYIDKLATKVHDDYNWASNKSYYSKAHANAIKKHGKTRWHREKFIRKILESA